MKRLNWRWLPNSLTILRLVAGVMLPWIPERWQFPVLVVAGVTDLIDGTLGRWLGGTSSFGRIADPIADKTLVLAAIGYALFQGWLSWPELLALAARDLTVLALSGLSLALNRENWRRFQARLSGKIATGLQLLALFALYAARAPQPTLIILAGAVSILSAADYTWFSIRALRTKA